MIDEKQIEICRKKLKEQQENNNNVNNVLPNYINNANKTLRICLFLIFSRL